MRASPTRLCLQDLAPERDLTEHATKRRRSVPSVQVGERVGRVARRVEPAAAVRTADVVHAERSGEPILVPKAGRNGGLAGKPEVIEERRGESHTSTRPGHRPRPPAEHGCACFQFPLRFAELHQRAFLGRRSAGWMTSSTSPYATASSGAMK